jgi:hypothetical protein
VIRNAFENIAADLLIDDEAAFTKGQAQNRVKTGTPETVWGSEGVMPIRSPESTIDQETKRGVSGQPYPRSYAGRS